MSDWPPKPSQPEPPQPTPPQENTQPSRFTPEQLILEKAVMASVEEQRRARRWSIFFKLLTLGYLLFLAMMMTKGCSQGSDDTAIAGEHLAVVNIEGTIASGRNNVNSEDTIKALRRAFKAPDSKAIVLNINSPGGSPVQSDDIWQEIRYERQHYPNKKVYAVIGDMGASGAYYIASAADEIYINPSSLVGSIGVIMPNYDLRGLAKKLGVEDRTLTAGQHKAILSMTQPIDPKEQAHVQNLLNNVHQHFINAVKEGRGKRLKATTPDLFSGLFWTGEQAIQLGLADKTGNLYTLARELKLDKKVDYTIEPNPLEAVLGRMGTSVGQGIGQSLAARLESSQQQTPLQ